MTAGLAHHRTLTAWLPVLVLPPILLLDAALTEEGRDVDAIGVLATVAACVPLVLRRRLDFLIMGPLVTASVMLVLWRIEPSHTVVLIPMVALFELAARTDRRRSIRTGVLVAPCVVVSVLPFVDDAADFAEVMFQALPPCLFALLAGDVVRARRAAAERLAAVREEEALRRLADERLRIAREVHDVVAHAMVAINVQAGVAAHLIDADPEQARSALRDIKAASGEALSDLRATLGVLRAGEGAAAPLGPAAGLGDLEELTGGLRAAGVDVRLDVGELGAVPAAVHAAGYRIVQEALTNVLRHARATRVDVRVAAQEGDVVIEVVDDGAGTTAAAGGAGAGAGVRGMRERAVALDGTLEAGPAPGGGWRVAARLPARAAEVRAAR